MMPMAAGAYEVGDQVALTSQLYGNVLSKNGTNHTVSVYANPDNKPTGALEIQNGLLRCQQSAKKQDYYRHLLHQ